MCLHRSLCFMPLVPATCAVTCSASVSASNSTLNFRSFPFSSYHSKCTVSSPESSDICVMPAMGIFFMLSSNPFFSMELKKVLGESWLLLLM